MRKYINIYLLSAVFILYSCADYLQPKPENIVDEEFLLGKPEYVEGVLIGAYVGLPNSYTFDTDVATDDAVTNFKDSPFIRLATGEWLSSFYPMSQWEDANQHIYYINKFLTIYESVNYATSPRNTPEVNRQKDIQHKKRLKGEAHGLRAWYKIQLLQYHGGKSADGKLLGFPIINDVIAPTDNWKLPRNTFAECVNSIMDDLDVAINNLPAIYTDIGNDDVGKATFGERFLNRLDGNTAKALKSRIALLAASPSFAESDAVTWAQSATIAGNLLAEIGTLPSTGKTFYLDTRHEENIWNNSQQNIDIWEQNNLPPSLFGYGRTNPSQNLVDAFPMENGYPITHALSGYDADDPYLNRDPRLSDYIIYNGSIFYSLINTYIGAPFDGINELETSTRTGYYLKKFMNPGVSLDPAYPVSRQHSYTLIRKTEVLLNYAESANEAWGPDGDPMGLGFTARSKIAELRDRAGINQPDDYLASITDKGEMRELIRNERRLELCFEGFRFWDIRRWGLTNLMNETVKGVFIKNDEPDLSYEYRDVEIRQYKPNMIYPPIPFNETLKYDIVQNAGW